MTITKDPASIRPPLSAEERVLVEDQLERILASPLFSQSKRYAPFLRHVVGKTLEGQEGTFSKSERSESKSSGVARTTTAAMIR